MKKVSKISTLLVAAALAAMAFTGCNPNESVPSKTVAADEVSVASIVKVSENVSLTKNEAGEDCIMIAESGVNIPVLTAEDFTGEAAAATTASLSYNVVSFVQSLEDIIGQPISGLEYNSRNMNAEDFPAIFAEFKEQYADFTEKLKNGINLEEGKTKAEASFNFTKNPGVIDFSATPYTGLSLNIPTIDINFGTGAEYVLTDDVPTSSKGYVSIDSHLKANGSIDFTKMEELPGTFMLGASASFAANATGNVNYDYNLSEDSESPLSAFNSITGGLNADLSVNAGFSFVTDKAGVIVCKANAKINIDNAETFVTDVMTIVAGFSSMQGDSSSLMMYLLSDDVTAVLAKYITISAHIDVCDFNGNTVFTLISADNTNEFLGALAALMANANPEL